MNCRGKKIIPSSKLQKEIKFVYQKYILTVKVMVLILILCVFLLKKNIDSLYILYLIDSMSYILYNVIQ